MKKYIPPTCIWVLIDRSNGTCGEGEKNYAFWFQTRTQARTFLKKHNEARRSGMSYSELVGPFKFKSS